jgi:hypothetical protein
MRVIISQLLKYEDNPELPKVRHDGYPADGRGMFTAEAGYEIVAVYIVPDTARVGEIVAEVRPCGQCARPEDSHTVTDHEWSR